MNDTAATPEILCRKCKTVVESADNYCRHCGTPTSQGAARSPWESLWFVILMLFVFGPFALPLLWRSHHFNGFWKVVLTVVVTGITVWAGWYTWNQLQTMLVEIQKLDL